MALFYFQGTYWRLNIPAHTVFLTDKKLFCSSVKILCYFFDAMTSRKKIAANLVFISFRFLPLGFSLDAAGRRLCIFLWKATGGFVRCCSSYHLSQYASLTCISAGRANPLGLGCTKAPAIYILKSEVSACGVRH